ncbi:SPFH domain-containing protein [uncultured Roseibium sp.]|uniref:SPFH domain-containing protein n=1 Tax=uncultured Roseibium sp. TaxID=1936171 RepID=UPI00261201A6|nr:SPFH domain-containing protein [uncultured Roseibium sp.]
MAVSSGASNAGGVIGPAPGENTFGNRFRSWRRRHTFSLGLTILTLLFIIAVTVPLTVVNVPAGHVGVLWKRFMGGTVTDFHFGEGIHLIFPWNRAFIYDARLRTIVRNYDTISSNGLTMKVEIATRYRINRESVGALHKQIGPNYPEVLLIPEIGSNAREVISRYTPEQLYSDARSFIQAQILERMVTQLGSSLISQSPSGQLVYIEDALIRSVTLPASVVEAIERKAQQYHVMLEYDFRIEREELERQRKNIEARGIREFQEIVSGTITDEYLRLRGIDATLAIASSNNSKIIVMGGSDGLPVILNTGEFNAGADQNDDEETLERISSPLVPNASKTEVQSTNAIQPDSFRFQPSPTVVAPVPATDSANPVTPGQSTTQIDTGRSTVAPETAPIAQEPAMAPDIEEPQSRPDSSSAFSTPSTVIPPDTR